MACPVTLAVTVVDSYSFTVHYVNVSVLIKFSPKDQFFTLIIISSPKKSYVLDVY